MTQFEQQAEQIGGAFKTPISARWVVQTGRRNIANSLLNMMRSARSPEQFNDAVYQFKRQILLPYYREVVHRLPEEQRALFLQRNPAINMKPTKGLGSYEELKKNPAFAESQYQGRPVNGAQNPRLLQIAGDPVESDLAARDLKVTPEDLQQHIREAYQERARQQFRKDMLAAQDSAQSARNKLAEDYANSWYGQVLGAISPEVTGYYQDVIRNPQRENSWDLAKAIAKDALVGIGSLYTGAAAGKVVSNPAVQAGLSGALDAGIEAARQGASNYYDMDLANILATGGVSATFPAILGGVAGMGSRIPGLGRVTRPIMRKLRGMMPNAAEEETRRAKEIHDRAAQATAAAYDGGDLVAREGADDLLQPAREWIENSPQKVLDPEPLTRDRVRDIVMDPELSAQYFTPPSRETYLDMIKQRMADGDQIMDIGGQQRYASDVAEDWLGKAKTQWQANWNEMSTPEPQKTWWDKAGEALVDVGSREETLRQRAKGPKTEPQQISGSLQWLMENDPNTIRMWEAGFVPSGNQDEMKVYNEWKSKFGGR